MRRGSGRLVRCILLPLIVAGLVAGCAGNKNSSSDADNTTSTGGTGVVCSKTENDITVELSTDKEEYKAGEDIKYTLTVKNDRDGYTISRVYAASSNDDKLAQTEAPAFGGAIKYGESSSYEGVLQEASKVENPAEVTKEKISGSVETVTLRPYVYVKYGGEEVTVRYIVDVIMFQNHVEFSKDELKSIKTVSCHDPSIIVGEDKEGKKCYYIFGSHRAWAKSYDLENWESFTNNLSTDYREILKEPAAWSAHGSTGYQVDGYMWAPDVVYNDKLGKWCMYLSVDGDKWYSSIVLLTADTLEGDWEYQGIVVYSGFYNEEYYNETDVAKVTGETELADRYKRAWGDYYPNNIDACVFYDDDGNLWMSYGSWSGGIFMLELDEETGFRDYSVTYEDGIHSDPYFGRKIAGGKYVTGEASYIQKIGDYYWLFMSYGELFAKGGYNVRVYRSRTPDGGYLDENGRNPFYDTYTLNTNDSAGIRLFGGYKWRSFSQGQVAQGHNSAFVDDDGRAYIVFHTRTTGGNEGHYVKVHQLFLNKNGWLVAAPYQTAGEKLDENGFSADEIAGKYDVILHELDIDYKNLGLNTPQTITLGADGTVTGAFAGTWSCDKGTAYIDLTLDGETYSGVILKMDIEGTNVETIVFTALGNTNQLTLWGSRVVD